jgi:RimJ/RimL family protein N-acetyltransferase
MEHRTWQSPKSIELKGQFITLKPLLSERDADALYTASHGTPEQEAIWKYLPYGPFDRLSSMKNWMETEMVDRSDLLTWTVFENAGNTQVGIVALLAIVPEHGRAEIGHVWFATAVHKSKVNTESQYLLLHHLFDRHFYRRVEWKCNALNQASRKTATRMGFIYEGRFRQHMFVRGKNRDTDWFAMTEKEWPRCRDNFDKWLYSDEESSLMELNNS